MTARKAAVPTVRPGWPGERFPPGSLVRYRARGTVVEGKVMELRERHAVVAAGADGRWKVSYSLLQPVTPSNTGGRLLEIQRLAHRLLLYHKRVSGLGEEWTFGFSLTTRRAGACHFNESRIYVAAGHCLVADPDEVRNTLLHEIAHAIAGPHHHHDRYWKAIAQAIGCTGDRCTTVRHAGARWIATCQCGQVYRRQRRSRRMTSALCRKCRRKLTWTPDTEGVSID